MTFGSFPIDLNLFEFAQQLCFITFSGSLPIEFNFLVLQKVSHHVLSLFIFVGLAFFGLAA